MRWLVFFLVILNGLMYAWFTFDRRGNDVAVSAQSNTDRVLAQAKPLVMVAEFADGELAERDLRKPEPEPEPVIEMCLALGPFPEVVSAKQVAGRLPTHGIAAMVVMMDYDLPPVHWVYIEAEATREASLVNLRKLQAARTDSFLVSHGEYENAISLGYFTKIDSARSVMQKQVDAGYKAHAILKTRVEEGYFLIMNSVDSLKFSTELLENIQLENNAVKKQEKPCETVASLKVFE